MHLRCLLYWHKLQSGPTLVSSQHDHALMHDMDYSLSIYDSCDVTLSVTLSDVTKKTHKKTIYDCLETKQKTVIVICFLSGFVLISARSQRLSSLYFRVMK